MQRFCFMLQRAERDGKWLVLAFRKRNQLFTIILDWAREILSDALTCPFKHLTVLQFWSCVMQASLFWAAVTSRGMTEVMHALNIH